MQTPTINGIEAATLTAADARCLVDAYYNARERGREPVGRERSPAAAWLLEKHHSVEKEVRRVLDGWTETIPAARWAKGIVGPVIAAGLAAHIDISRCPTAGRMWRFAGLDPTRKWAHGEKRPWNATLKTICWKIGDCFAKAAAQDGHFYGKLYLQRKSQEEAANDAGKFDAQAAARLRRGDVDAQERNWYAQGKLPPAHIDARARRWVVKLFLAHYHHVAWTLAMGEAPAKPYVISILGHGGYIQPPDFPPATGVRR